jgi:c-di-AMP phosphodiesterase-like protein
MFIDSFTAQDRLRSDTLLIISDVNNKTQFESADLAANAGTIVYIDHHRQAAEFEVKPAIKYIEPTASSTCELVADMLEQTLPAGALSKDEADLMLAGIVLDTKKFAVNTGTKTFGAAQYLEGEGASPIDVQELFAASRNEFVRESYFMADLRAIADDTVMIAISHRTDNTGSDRIAAVKAADKLLSIDGVLASFAICDVDGAIRISGRSGGKINVQRIMEKLGGGGHFEAAATAMNDVTVDEAADILEKAVYEYLEEAKSAKK